MKATYLIDTSVLLQAWHTPQRLSQHQRDILNSDSVLHVSIATVWEISIKVALAKLQTVDNVAEAIKDTGYLLLPIKAEHAEAVRFLPHHHRDPFDRMLIAQAQVEGFTILTTDSHFTRYDVALA